MVEGLLSFEELCSLFIVSLLEKAHAFADGPLNRYQRSRLGESMTADIRKLCDMAFPAARSFLVSAAAKELADAMGLDLRQVTWHSQKKIDDYKTFTYEHLYPVREIRLALAKAADREEALGVLDRMLWVAWITKQEDKRLSELGFASVREDPFEAYEQAGIELLSDADVSTNADAPMDCMSCGRRVAGWVVTARTHSNAPGRLLIYCDTCRLEKVDVLSVMLPLSAVQQDPDGALRFLYRTGATASDPDQVAELLGIPKGHWAQAAKRRPYG